MLKTLFKNSLDKMDFGISGDRININFIKNQISVIDAIFIENKCVTYIVEDISSKGYFLWLG